MAELDATQIPEEITPLDEMNTTDLTTEETPVENIEETPEEEVVTQEPKKEKPLTKAEVIKLYTPKTRSSISTETSKVQTSTEAVSTGVQKPAPQKLKSTEGELLIEGGIEAKQKREYFNKKLESQLSTGKKPEFKIDAKLELENFLGAKAGAINWNDYDKSKLEAEREAIKAEIEKDVDPNYDYTGVLTFLSTITPNALKSGATAAASQLTAFVGGIAQMYESGSKKSLTGGAWGETDSERKASLPKPGEENSKALYDFAVKLDKKSQDYMMVAEKNSGIKEENIGKGAFELLSSNKEGDAWDGLKKLGLSVTQQLPQLVALAASSGVSGGVLAGATVLGTGGAITEEYKADQDISTFDGWQSVGKGFIEGLTEELFKADIKALRSIGGTAIKLDMSGAKKTLKDYLAKQGKQAFRDKLNRTYFQSTYTALKNTIGEGAEEVISAIGSFVIDRLEDGNWNEEEYAKLKKNIQESFTVGAATGFATTVHTIKTSVVPLTMDQKRKIISFRQVANDQTVDKSVREIAQNHSDDIIQYNADLSLRKYSVVAALPFEKRKKALAIQDKINGLEANKAKLKNVEAEAQVDKDIAKLQQDWGKIVVDHAMETAQADAKAKAEKKANAPKVMTSNSTEVSTATEALEVDEAMIEGDFDLLKGLTKEQKQTLVNIQKAMQSIDPDGKIMMYATEAEMRKGLMDAGLTAKEAYEKAASSSAEFTTKKGGADPVVHVNISNTEDAVRSASHEVAHLALLELAKTNPEAFVAMRDSVLRVMSNSQAKPLVDFASRYSAKSETDEAKQDRAEEFLAEMIGALTSGDGKIERTVLDQLARIIRDFLLQASRSLGNKNLEDFINKTFADTTSSEALVKYFEGLASNLKVGGKIEASHLRDVVPLTASQEARLKGLTPGTEAYHEASMLNAVERSPSAARPTMEADQSLVENPNDVVSRSQLADANFADSVPFKKYLKVVKGMTPDDIWLGRALFMDENRGGKMFASGSKDEIIEQMKKEMDVIEADANNSTKYYLTELKPPYIAAQIAKYEKDPRFTDNLTEWKMIRDNESMRERYIKEKAAEQKASLTGNIAYLKGNDTYDIPFQYAMIKDGIASRYTVIPSAEEGGESQIQRDPIKPSQLNSTEKPIISMQPGIVASAYGDYANYNTEPGRGYLVAQINMPKIEVTASEFAPFIFKQSDTGEGTWLKFNQSSNKEDAKPLFKIASTSHKYPAQWCTGGALSTAQNHLTGGDFYIFIDAKTGDARIAVRYKGKDQIAEVRGLGAGQSVLPEDAGIINELVNDLPGGIEYKKDAKVQNTLKEIIDSLPDEASKKRFALTETDFKQWLLDTNYDKIVENSNTIVKINESAAEKIIEIDNVIEDIVIKKLADKSSSKQDIIDIISLVDKSYRQQNHALTRTKQVISQNINKVFEPLGYEKGSVIKTSTIQASDNPAEYENVRLVVGDFKLLNTGDSVSFPKLEDVTGYIGISDSLGVDTEYIKRSPAIISFPKITNSSKLKIDSPWGNIKLNFDSLKKIEELVIEDNENNNNTELNFPKLETLGTNENLYIGEKTSFNAPLLKQITNSSNDAYVDVYGELNAPNLNLISGDIIIEEGAYVNLDKLKEVSILKVNNNTVDLPSLKNVSSISVDNNGVLNLNEIDTNVNGATWGSKISATNESKIFINKLTTFSDSTSTKIDASDNSKIRIGEIEREGGFNILGGVNGYSAYDASEITVLKGSNTSWADVYVRGDSKVNLPGVYKIKELTVDDSVFTSDSAESIFKVAVSNGEVKLNNTISINNAEINGTSVFEAGKLISLSDLRATFFNEGLGKNKIYFPNLDNIRRLKIEGSQLSLPNIKNVWLELRVDDYAKANLPNLTLVGGEGLTVGNNSFASLPSLSQVSGKSLYINVESQLEAPELSELPTDTYIQDSSKLLAPKLGYNNTSTPDATVAKSQLAKDIKKLDEAIYTVSMAPSVKFWMEPEFVAERRGIPQTGTPATVVFGKKDNPEGVSDFVAYYAENGNLVSILNMLTEPNKDSESSKGAFKITVDPAERRKGYAKLLLDAAQDNGLDIIGNVKANRFSGKGRDLVRDWIKVKRDALVAQKNDLSTSDEMATEAAQSLAKASGTTQVATTTGSYEKAARILKGLNVTGDVLDYGAGLGLGTDAMSKVLGSDVKSYDINPERWKGKGSVTYTNAKDINKRFDGIVSLNVVNVVPKDIRDFVVTNIFDNLNVGGTAIISSRKFKGDIDQAKSFELGTEDKSYIIKRKKDGKTVDVFQKGYDGDELVDYVKGLLGDAATVKKNNTFGAAGVVITKNAELPVTAKSQLAPNGKPSNLNRAQYETVRTPEFKAWFGDWENDPENASKFVDENGEPQVFYHGTYAEFERFSTDPEFKRYGVHTKGIFFTPTVIAARSYGDIQMPVFLNAKSFDYNEANFDNSFVVERQKENEVLNNTDKEGVVFRTADKEGFDVKQYIVFDPDQILLAGDKTYAKSQLAPRIKSAIDKLRGKSLYVPGTSSAKKYQKDAKKKTPLEKFQLFEKEITERNVTLADFMKNADMMQSLYNMYNKAGATPLATRKFADAYNDIYGKVNGKSLSSTDKGFLDDVILLRRTIAIDENFDSRKKERPAHTSFVDYVTGQEVLLSKEEALKQLNYLKTKVYDTNQDKLAELEYRAQKYFDAFSDILKYKQENGLLTQEEYDLYKNYSYQPRKFLKFLLGDTKPDAFSTRGVQITKDELKSIESGDDGYMMTDSEKLLKMGFVSAVNKVFSNRAKKVMFDELAGRNLGWAMPANIDTYANGTPKLEPDGSPKLLEPKIGFRNMTFKVDGKRNAFQLKEGLAREFEDTEMWDTKNWLYKLSANLLGAKLTSAFAVGINTSFILTNIPVDITSQIHYNNLYSSKLGVTGQYFKGFSGVLANSLRIAKLKTGLGDNSRILNAIGDYGKMGGLQNTLAYDTNFLGKVGDALGMLGDISELASKITAFENKRADLVKGFEKDNGRAPNQVEYDKLQMQAAYEARSAMDFNRGGRAIKFMNAFIPFLNVTTQVAKISTTYVKNNFPAFTKKMMQAALPYAGLTLYNLMVAGDDWENEDLKRVRRNKIVIMSPFKNEDGTHSYTQIQVPIAVKAFLNVSGIIAENIYYSQIASAQGIKAPEVDKDMMQEMIDNLKMFVPNVTSLQPSTTKFFYEYANNKSLWNERSLSQDALKNIIVTEEGEENPDILSLVKILSSNAAKITYDQIEVSPERFQKAAEDSFFTNPESQALLSMMYTIADQMTNFAVGGVDEKIRSKYVADGDFSQVMGAFLGTFKKRLIGKTDKTKNDLYYDAKDDIEMIKRLQREENSNRQDISNKIKGIFKSYKKLDLPYTEAKPEIMEFYKSIKDNKDKEYAKNYIEMMIGRSKVELTNNIPKYLLILNEAKSARTKATAIYALFTMRGQDPMTDKTLQKDLAKMGFSGEVVKAYKKVAKIKEAKPKPETEVREDVDPVTGLPPGFNPEDYK